MPNGDDVQDRLAKRFEDEDDGVDEQSERNDQREETDMRSDRDMRDMNDQNENRDGSEENEENGLPAGSAWNVENVKQEWNGVSFYLPDELVDPMNDEWSRLNYVADGDYKKDRHFKTLVVLLGMERMVDMEGEELDERIERMTRMELLDDG
ncbi:hypothetical protein [Halorussus marinus]|uniref:hypothetical protein n=1 Tax=Halorussus marinus TaxID=2505976 RepID=UPI00109228A6|nr:hypothetical protein [Halorussus marinus]